MGFKDAGSGFRADSEKKGRGRHVPWLVEERALKFRTRETY